MGLLTLLIILSSCGGGSTGSATKDGVQEQPSTAKEITSFELAGVEGIINKENKTIAVNLPYGSSVTALIAKFSTTGDSVVVNGVAQISETTPNNFTSPLIYKVIADDGSEQNYTVLAYIMPENRFRALGNMEADAEQSTHTSLAIDKNNVEYVAYVKDKFITVVKFNGTAREVVGSPKFAGGTGIGFMSLKIDSNNIPYVAFSDGTLGATVMKFVAADNMWHKLGE